MKVKFTVHTSKMKTSIQDECNRSAHILAQQVAKDTEPFVPAETLSLSRRTIIKGDTIIYPGPYARYLYYGKLMIDPNTGSSYAPKGGSKVLTNKDLVFSKAVHSQAQSHWFDASKAQNIEKWERVAEKAVRSYV